MSIYKSLRILSSTLVILLAVQANATTDVKSDPTQTEAQFSKPFAILTPSRKQNRTAIEIIKNLRYRHYKRIKIDNSLSNKILTNYLSNLDPDRSFFLQEDIRGFKIYRNRLDNLLLRGNITPAFKIYNRYCQRLKTRLDFFLKHLSAEDNDLNFALDEYLQTDREKAPWACNMTQLKNLWRRQLKNEILTLKFSGKAPAEIQKMLQKRYINTIKQIRQTKNEDVFRFFMNAVTQSYDPHTQYYSPRLFENFGIQMRLSLEGIGAMLQTDNEYTKIVRLVPAGPADKSKKLHPGDRIMGVGQEKSGPIVDVVGWRIDDVVDLIRGPKNTVVRLEILPADVINTRNTNIVTITRGTVKLEDQAAKKRIIEITQGEKVYHIGVIELPTFYVDFDAYQAKKPNYRSTTRDVRKLLKELKKEAVDGVIVDLRGNGGGALQEANTLTGLFLKKGPIVQVRRSSGSILLYRDNDPELAYAGPLIVIVDRLSASAAEIFSAAIQDYHRGVIVGSQTFGKGSVQSIVDLSHGKLTLTMAKYYRVTGNSTQHRGVMPDILFPAFYDKTEIGESALDGAIMWDQINPADYVARPDLSPLIEKLRRYHQKRIKNSTPFRYLTAGINALHEIAKITKVSVNEKKRRAEQAKFDVKRIAIENRLRVSKGQPPIKSIAELEKIKEDEVALNANKKRSFIDPILAESGQVLVDLINLQPLKFVANSS